MKQHHEHHHENQVEVRTDSETKKQSITKKVAQNKLSGTKSQGKVSAKVGTSKDDKIGKFPEFLKGKLFFGDKRYKDYKNCNQMVKASGLGIFTKFCTSIGPPGASCHWDAVRER